MPLIALLTDYGYKDPYVGILKGVIKRINPAAEIVDLTHGVERQNIREGALILKSSAKYFPPGTIFVAVVDPGVGSQRRSILVKTRNYILVGPDNGLLSLLAIEDGIEEVYDIGESRYRLERVSGTFHGRDIFAPVAAYASLGVPLSELGERVDSNSIQVIEIPKPSVHGESVRARVIYVDVYGNVLTNVEPWLLDSLGWRMGDTLLVEAGSARRECTLTRSFSLVKVGELACYISSFDYLELGVNMGDASRELGVRLDDELVIRKAG
ncbi:S-adenosyl-l-methionine hydroxide adenosyltransferase family protein [Thermogladius sp. KZ2Tp1]|uniref:SAM hydrolase/SAM-dependent halogenase family protein n=1 Tax=Thermogladius sp. KZ2Tp1 TaxID=3136289 RepID=UPI003DA8E9F9